MKKYVAFEANNAEMEFFDSIEDAQRWIMSRWIDGGVDHSSVPETFVAEVILKGTKTPFTPENMLVEVGEETDEDEKPDEKRKIWLDTGVIQGEESVQSWTEALNRVKQDETDDEIDYEYSFLRWLTNIIKSKHGKVTFSDAYNHYIDFCSYSLNMNPVSKKCFSQMLSKMGYKRKRTGKHRYILGISLH